MLYLHFTSHIQIKTWRSKTTRTVKAREEIVYQTTLVKAREEIGYQTTQVKARAEIVYQTKRVLHY